MGWYTIKNQVSTELYAPMYVYSQINGGQDAGSSPVDALKLALNQGVDTESHYSQGDYNWWDLPTSEEHTNAALNKPIFHRYTTIFANSNGRGGDALVSALKSAISNYQPVAILFPVRPGFQQLAPGNSVDNDTTGTISGYHEVLALGYDSDGLVIQNHWGTEWGAQGFATLSWNVVKNDISEAETVSE